MSAAVLSDYRLATPRMARLVGGVMVLSALIIFAVTLVTAVLRGPLAVVFAVALLAVIGLAVLAVWLRSVPVVRFTAEGYRVRLVRGAGATRARWDQVTEAATAHRAGEACIILTLANGSTTTIPVSLLDCDREAFVRDLQERLQDGQRLRPL